MTPRARRGAAATAVPPVVALVTLALTALACAGPATAPVDGAAGALPGEARYTVDRREMVYFQLRNRDITNPRVLRAMRRVPRHRFVPLERRYHAYADRPLHIGFGQTISQPYVVALMCQLLELEPDDRVLEVGTGSGYHAAVLSHLARQVYTVEIVEPLAERARRTLEELGYANVRVRHGDGYGGWPEASPFDAILLTAAPPRVPQPLLDQLAVGGRLLAPVGEGSVQDLVRVTRGPEGYVTERIVPVRFVPMTGEAETLQEEEQEDRSPPQR